VATGVRRETAGGYLRSAGIGLRRPGGWGRKPPVKPAIEVITGFFYSTPADNSKPANEVITGFFPEVRLPEQVGQFCRESLPYPVYKRTILDVWCGGPFPAIDLPCYGFP
jgi:hypothetical protein